MNHKIKAHFCIMYVRMFDINISNRYRDNGISMLFSESKICSFTTLQNEYTEYKVQVNLLP